MTTDRLRSTGIITILVHRVKNIESHSSRRPAKDRPIGITKFDCMPEGVTKGFGLSHYGRFDGHFSTVFMKLMNYSVDEPKRRGGSRSLCYKNVDGKNDEDAIAIFNFKYRSLGK